VVRTPGQDAGTAAEPVASAADLELVARLRAGDEAAFAEVVGRYHASMLRVALMYVSSRAVAEEVVQEAWLGVLRQLDRFEGRSSLKTWIFRIVTNTAKSRGAQERRTVPFSALVAAETEPGQPAVEPERFLDQRHRWARHWATPPQAWDGLPEARLLSEETMGEIQRVIDGLPPVQRAVITLRDVEGCTGAEVCGMLDLSEGNQRVLLHRARVKVRRALERYFGGGRSGS